MIRVRFMAVIRVGFCVKLRATIRYMGNVRARVMVTAIFRVHLVLVLA